MALRQSIVFSERDLTEFIRLAQALLTEYEEESGTYLSDLYAKFDELTLEKLTKIANASL